MRKLLNETRRILELHKTINKTNEDDTSGGYGEGELNERAPKRRVTTNPRWFPEKKYQRRANTIPADHNQDPLTYKMDKGEKEYWGSGLKNRIKHTMRTMKHKPEPYVTTSRGESGIEQYHIHTPSKFKDFDRKAKMRQQARNQANESGPARRDRKSRGRQYQDIDFYQDNLIARDNIGKALGQQKVKVRRTGNHAEKGEHNIGYRHKVGSFKKIGKTNEAKQPNKMNSLWKNTIEKTGGVAKGGNASQVKTTKYDGKGKKFKPYDYGKLKEESQYEKMHPERADAERRALELQNKRKIALSNQEVRRYNSIKLNTKKSANESDYSFDELNRKKLHNIKQQSKLMSLKPKRSRPIKPLKPKKGDFSKTMAQHKANKLKSRYDEKVYESILKLNNFLKGR